MAKGETIVFRADGNKSIGLGHFSRSLALANMLSEDFFCVFAISEPDNNQKNQISKICDKLIELPGGNKHFDAFLNHISPDWTIVLDNYYYNTEYQKTIKQKGCKLVCIDDINDKHFVSDILINHSPSVSSEKISTEAYTRLLLGLDYVLLRKEFLKAAAGKPTVPEETDILICFGGSDYLNLSMKISQLLINNVTGKIKIITGSAFQSLHDLNNWIQKEQLQEKVLLYSNLNAAEIIDLTIKSSLAIIPSSGILFEIMSIRRPLITGFFAENQKQIAENLINENGGVFYAGDFRKITETKLISLVDKAANSDFNIVAGYQSQWIDGDSQKRIINEFKKII